MCDQLGCKISRILKWNQINFHKEDTSNAMPSKGKQSIAEASQNKRLCFLILISDTRNHNMPLWKYPIRRIHGIIKHICCLKIVFIHCSALPTCWGNSAHDSRDYVILFIPRQVYIWCVYPHLYVMFRGRHLLGSHFRNVKNTLQYMYLVVHYAI